MKKETNQNMKLGIFVILSFIAFATGVYFIGSQQSLFGSNIKVNAVFENVEGLQAGNNVRFSGITAGSVKSINFINDSSLLVTMLINKNMQAFLKKNALANVEADGLVGNMIVNIVPSKEASPIVKNNDTIQTLKKQNTNELINSFGTTSQNLSTLTQNLIDITDKMNTGTGSFNLLLSNEKMAQDLSNSINNLVKASNNVEIMTSNLRRSIKGIEEGKGALGYLLYDPSLKTQVSEITDQLDTLLNDNIATMLNNLSKSSEEISSASTRLRAQIAQIDAKNGVVNALINDTLMTIDMKKSLEHLNEGTSRFNESMEALQNIWPLKGFINKKKKSEEKAIEKQNTSPK